MYNENSRKHMSPKDPDFWGIYGDEFMKKKAVGKLNRWWDKERKKLPRDLPKARKLEQVLNSFDKALTEMKDTDSQDDVGCGIVSDHVYVNPESVYFLIAQYYNTEPKRVRDVFYEV